ncbi:MAG: hypothetical protein PHF57_10565, partial [Methanoregula sp.]|nr:hypothetical protein [Methanoregula sp.]
CHRLLDKGTCEAGENTCIVIPGKVISRACGIWNANTTQACIRETLDTVDNGELAVLRGLFTNNHFFDLNHRRDHLSRTLQQTIAPTPCDGVFALVG